jgi:hypothetical protein
MTAYSDLATAASDFDTSAADLIDKAKALIDKAATYETSIRTGSRFEGRADTADIQTTIRAALVAAIVADDAASAYKFAKALRLPIRTAGKLAALAFPA